MHTFMAALAPAVPSEPPVLGLAADAAQHGAAGGADAIEGPAKRMADLIRELGPEDGRAKQLVYMATISRVLPDTLAEVDNLIVTATLSRQAVGEAARKAFDDPLPNPAGGRPVHRADGVVKKIAAFKEAHADGGVHFHVVVVLSQPRSWAPAKRTLRARDHIASHWSCSHSQVWSALRYNVIPSATKPVVDGQPWTWTKDGSLMDLFAESQQPWQSCAWKRRREDLRAGQKWYEAKQ